MHSTQRNRIYWPLGELHSKYFVAHYSFEVRSKDSMVYLWEIPDSPAEGFSETPCMSHLLEHVTKPGQADLTSLHWNPDGTLLAIGSYNSILRICTLEGSIYFTHHQHQVCLTTVRFSPLVI